MTGAVTMAGLVHMPKAQAMAYYCLKDYDKARADLFVALRLGYRPDRTFVQALQQAVARPSGIR